MLALLLTGWRYAAIILILALSAACVPPTPEVPPSSTSPTSDMVHTTTPSIHTVAEPIADE